MRASSPAPNQTALAAVFAALAACSAPTSPVASVRDIGTVPNPPTVSARDVGFSAKLKGKSVWIFGDTLFSEPAADGFQWRSSSWSWTNADSLGPFEHALGADGKPLQLLPHTEQEDTFNREHRDEPRRHTPWPQALVSDGDRAVIFYVNMATGPDGPWDFSSRSGSVATWTDPGAPAQRVEPPLFSDDEPDWGAAAVLVGDHVYTYACEGRSKGCKVARVPFAEATSRAAYRFFDGDRWSTHWEDATEVFDGAPLFSVHESAHLGAFVALYMAPGDDEMRVRTAPAPEGPWSDAAPFGEGKEPSESFDYAFIAHPELAREGGAVEIASYTRPIGWLQQETRLVELRWK